MKSSDSTFNSVLLIVSICVLYEWVGVFEVGTIRYVVYALKIMLPIILLMKMKSYSIPRNKGYVKYLLFYVLFMLWAVISNAFSGAFLATMQEWLKYAIRLIACYAIAEHLYQREDRQIVIMKAFVIIAVCTVAQYALMQIGRETGIIGVYEMPIDRGGYYYGPYGIMGNGTGLLGTAIEGVRLIRLTGFWLEPSLTSGFLFMAMYLSMALRLLTKDKFWKYAPGICFVGGLLTFSFAGYVALFATYAFGQAFYIVRVKKRRVLRAASIAICLAIAAGVLMVRTEAGNRYIADNYADYELIITMARIRSGSKYLEGEAIDGERTSDAKRVVRGVKNNILGYGMHIPGREINDEVREGSASAPFIWLLYTGYLGLVLLFLREYEVMKNGLRSALSSPYNLFIFQAYCVLFIQQLSYGTWMTPLFFTVVLLVFFSNSTEAVKCTWATARKSASPGNYGNANYETC